MYYFGISDIFTEYGTRKKRENLLFSSSFILIKKIIVIAAGTFSNEDVEDTGLSQGYAFIILGINEIKGERVIRIRNPWGEGEFNGDWSDFSLKKTKI